MKILVLNSYNLIARVHTVPSYALVGGTNRPLLKFLVRFTKQIKTDSTRIIELAVIIWGNKAEAAATVVKEGSTVAISGEIDFDSFAPSRDDQPRPRTIIVANTIQILSQPCVDSSN